MIMTKVVVIILISLNIAVGGELSSDEKKQEQNAGRLPKRLFQYNPTPVSIPVAIVFDDNEDLKQESFDIEVKKFNEKPSPVKDKVTEKSNTSTIVKLSGVFSIDSSKSDKNNSNQIQAKGINANDLQIPVAVVYDEAPATPRIQKKLRRKNRVHAGQQVRKVPKTTTTQLPRVAETKITQSHEEVVGTTSEKSLTTKTLDSDSKSQRRTRVREPVIPIIQSENRVFGHNGDFHYSYEGGDGTKAFETGELRSFADDKTGEAVMGGFSYTAKDGQDYSLSYTADENGYRPVGAHLPTPPPIPPAIERALRYLATKTTPETVTESAKSN